MPPRGAAHVRGLTAAAMITASKLVVRFVFMDPGLIADLTAVALSIRGAARITIRTLSENILLFISVPFISRDNGVQRLPFWGRANSPRA